jgi:HlyD family secretion protein
MLSTAFRVFFSLGACSLAFLAGVGCSKTGKENPQEPKPLEVTVAKPKLAAIHREVRQPGFIEAWEQTALFPKIAGYVEKWNVDIGDKVDKDKVLAELYVPEMVEEVKQKAALVTQAKAAFEVAQAGLQRAKANERRWQLEYNRISKLTDGVIDKQVKEETQNQLESAQAGFKESEALRNKAQADIAVAQADHKRVAALLSYATIKAPFQGVVTRRNINSGDFVQPPTAGKGEPLFVVQSRDVMRIFVEVPETDAAWIEAKKTKASISIQALKGQVFPGVVARTSYALDRAARTLLAEIDLENPKDQLRPGMYAFATLSAESGPVLTIPVSAIVTQGDVTQGYQTYCYVEKGGKARRTFLEVGIRDQQRIEVMKKRSQDARQWSNFDGEERIIVSGIADLTDSKAVQVEEKK